MTRLGDVRHFANGYHILTTIRYIPVCNGMYQMNVWTPIPEGMTPQDLGRKFTAASAELELLPVPQREDL